MFRELITCCGSIIKGLEILYVQEGLKLVSRLSVQDPKQLKKILAELSLHWEESDFKVDHKAQGGTSYSDKAVVSESGVPLLYVARSKDLAKKAKELDKSQEHEKLGELFGYPSCCCKFFAKHIAKPSYDLTLEIANQSEGMHFPWELNICLRHFDMSLLSHFPCSFACEQSKEIARKNIEFIKSIDASLATHWQWAFKQPVLYAQDLGVYSFSRCTVTDSIIEYHPSSIIYSAKNDFYTLLTQKSRIVALSPHRFLVGGVEVADEKTLIAFFEK